MKLNLQNELKNNPHLSTRKLADLAGISQVSVIRALRLMKWHPYKLTTVQKLYPEDYENRKTFSEVHPKILILILKDELTKMDEDSDYLQSIWFSNEATFFVSGEVNRHNFRYWSPIIQTGTEKLHYTRKKSMYGPR